MICARLKSLAPAAVAAIRVAELRSRNSALRARLEEDLRRPARLRLHKRLARTNSRTQSLSSRSQVAQLQVEREISCSKSFHTLKKTIARFSARSDAD